MRLELGLGRVGVEAGVGRLSVGIQLGLELGLGSFVVGIRVRDSLV